MANLSPLIAAETPPLFWLEGFNGTNQHDARVAIDDQECFWMENFIPLGKGNARTLYDHGTVIYTASQDIVFDFPFNIGATFYHALFLADGSAVQVNVLTLAVTVIGAAGTFAVSPTVPDCAQWAASGIIIVTADTNGYFAWDGTLYSPGDFAPLWLSGMTALLHPTGNTNSNTTVNAVSSTTGTAVGMRISGTVDIPVGTLITVIVPATSFTISNAATGSTGAVVLTIGWSMPLGVNGTAVETYQNRVWIINGAQFAFSAPSNGANFSTTYGGGVVTSTDGFLNTKYVSLKQSNSFLYLFGDSSVNVISNVQTSGSPLTTTFNNQNVDPINGLGWPNAITSFGRAIAFANPTGVYLLFGGDAQKISDKIDRLFEKADFAAVVPSMFSVALYGVRCLGIVLNTLDPTTNTMRTMKAMWATGKWFVGIQSLNTVFVDTMVVNASPQGWGNDKRKVYQLYTTASSTLTKKVVSKLWAGRSNLIKKTTQDVYVETADLGDTGVVLTGTLDSDTNQPVAFTLTSNLTWLNSSGGVITFTNSGGMAINWIANPPGIQGTKANQAGMRLGLTLTSTSPDFELVGMGETYNENAWYGR